MLRSRIGGRMKVLVVDDHPLFRDAMVQLLRQLSQGAIVLAADSGAAAAALVTNNPDLDLALIDLMMPGEDGFSIIRRCLQIRPELPVLVISAADSSAELQRSIAAGALAHIPKSAPAQSILDAIRRTLLDRNRLPRALPAPDPRTAHPAFNRLTLRQLEVLALLCEGRTNKAIGTTLNVAEQTVKVHVNAIFRTLNVVNRTQAVLVAQTLGINKR